MCRRYVRTTLIMADAGAKTTVLEVQLWVLVTILYCVMGRSKQVEGLRPPPSALRPPPSALRPPPSSLLPVIEHAASATTEQRSANCHHRVDVSVIISFASGVKVATVASSTAAEANAFEKEA